MELADRSLLDRLQEATGQGLPGIPLTELLEYMHDAARGIDHLNALGIQHRDIKPHNLLLVGDGVRVADFGLAKLLHHTLTSNTGAMTPAYAAPEFFQGQTSSQSDQYALAVTYCELRGDRLPFQGSYFQVMAGHATQPPDLAMLPEAERPALARALAKQPHARWPSCRAFVDALTADAGVHGRTPASAPPVPPISKTETLPVPAPATQPESRSHPLRPPNAATSPVRPPRLVGRPGRRSMIAIGLIVVALVVFEVLVALRPGGKEPENLPREVTNAIGMRLVLILPGKFSTGSPPGEARRTDDEEQHEVEITRPFYLGAYEVTQAEYQQVHGTNPSYFSPKRGAKGKAAKMNTDRFPVETVSWEEATEFCRKLSDLPEEKGADHHYRLPTEAEWEYACRSGSRSVAPFHFGGSLSAKQGNIDRSHPYGGAAKGASPQRTSKVGSYEATALGLYDMHGNVGEWCQDWYSSSYYHNSPVMDPQGPEEGECRVVRGGSWCNAPWLCRVASRSKASPSDRHYDLGFRVVRVAGSRAP
jgi:formylglycine-generating enzyme required for sulfatase activity